MLLPAPGDIEVLPEPMSGRIVVCCDSDGVMGREEEVADAPEKDVSSGPSVVRVSSGTETLEEVDRWCTRAPRWATDVSSMAGRVFAGSTAAADEDADVPESSEYCWRRARMYQLQSCGGFATASEFSPLSYRSFEKRRGAEQFVPSTDRSLESACD